MNVAFPFRLDGRGRTATVDDDTHVRDLVELVLFTNQGERVKRPDFGSSIEQLVFGPSTPEIAASVQSLVQGSLERWLSDSLRVEAVEVASRDSSLRLTVRYRRVEDQTLRQVVFEREIEP